MSKIIKFELSKNLLNPYFEGYKLCLADGKGENLLLKEYRFPGFQVDLPALNSLDTSFQILQKAALFNKLFQGPAPNSLIFIDSENFLVEFSPFEDGNELTRLLQIPESSNVSPSNLIERMDLDTNSELEESLHSIRSGRAHFSSVFCLNQETMLVFNGISGLFVAAVEPKSQSRDQDQAYNSGWSLKHSVDLSELLDLSAHKSPILLNCKLVGTVVHIIMCAETLKPLIKPSTKPGNESIKTGRIKIVSAWFKIPADDSHGSSDSKLLAEKLHVLHSSSVPDYVAYYGCSDFNYIIATEDHPTLEFSAAAAIAAATAGSLGGNSGSGGLVATNLLKSSIDGGKGTGEDGESTVGKDGTYSWSQNQDEITMAIDLPFYIEKERIFVEFTNTTMSIALSMSAPAPILALESSDASISSSKESGLNTAAPAGLEPALSRPTLETLLCGRSLQTFDLISPRESFWDIKNNKLLTLRMKKQIRGDSDSVGIDYSGGDDDGDGGCRDGSDSDGLLALGKRQQVYMRWPHVFAADDGIAETFEDSELATISKKLDSFTSCLDDPIKETPIFEPRLFSEFNGYDNDYDQVSDSEKSKSVVFSGIDGQSGAVTHRLLPGGGIQLHMDFICAGFSNILELNNDLKLKLKPELSETDRDCSAAETTSNKQVCIGLPSIVLKYDIDGLVFDIKSILLTPSAATPGSGSGSGSGTSLKANTNLNLKMDVDVDADAKMDNNIIENSANPEIFIRGSGFDFDYSSSSNFEPAAKHTFSKLEICHSATFNALSFVLASKREKKFVYSDHLSRYVIVAENSKRIYIYWSAVDSKSLGSVQNIVELPPSVSLSKSLSTPAGSESGNCNTNRNGNESDYDNTILGILPIDRGHKLVILCKYSIFVYRML